MAKASANAGSLLGLGASRCRAPASPRWAATWSARVRALAQAGDLAEPQPLQCHDRGAWPCAAREFEGTVYRHPAGGLVLELEPAGAADGAVARVECGADAMRAMLAAAVERYSAASTIAALADAVVQSVRDLVGYDRVMVYKFDPDGHGEIIAEARDPSARLAARPSTIRRPTSRSARASCTCATACGCWSTSTTTRAGVRASAPGGRRPRHVAVPPAQHVAAAPAVPAQHGRDRDAGRVAGARRAGCGA